MPTCRSPSMVSVRMMIRRASSAVAPWPRSRALELTVGGVRQTLRRHRAHARLRPRDDAAHVGELDCPRREVAGRRVVCDAVGVGELLEMGGSGRRWRENAMAEPWRLALVGWSVGWLVTPLRRYAGPGMRTLPLAPFTGFRFSTNARGPRHGPPTPASSYIRKAPLPRCRERLYIARGLQTAHDFLIAWWRGAPPRHRACSIARSRTAPAARPR